jgi:hypothetical protein
VHRNAKSVVYEVFGPVGTVANISYFDPVSDFQRIDATRLPRLLKVTSSVPAIRGQRRGADGQQQCWLLDRHTRSGKSREDLIRSE